MKSLYNLALSFFLPMFCTIQAQDFSHQLDEFLGKRISKNQPGVAVLAWKDGKTIYKKGFGAERQGTSRSINSSTTFRMASVSKQFTAMGIMLLEKNHKLSFEDKISRFFPELKPELSEKITLRHLLTHTSGIPDYESLMNSTWKRQIMDEDIVKLLTTESKTYFTPGSKFQYSNTAFCLLAMVVERVSGKPYNAFMQENVFNKLEMKNTFLFDAKHPVATRSLGYAKDEKGVVRESDQSLTSATLGDGCVYTSLDDYLIWYKSLTNNTLVGLKSNIDEIGYSFPSHPESGYGLGWFYTKAETGLELTHSGTTCGFSNMVILVPEKDMLVVCFSNLADNHGIYKEIVQIIQQDERFRLKIDWSEMHSLTN